MPAPTPRAVPSIAATRLTADQFQRIWKGVREDTELYLAVQQLLAFETVAAIEEATNPALAERPGALAAAQGQVNALLALAVSLEEARTKPEKWMPAKS